MLKEPIVLTLYDDKNEVVNEFKCMIIPWKMLKKALSFSKYISNEAGKDEINADIFDAMGQFVCELFHNQFTIDELNEGADITEVMVAINAVVSHAGALNPNA
jgi:aspartate ammonia-lyase